MLELKGIHKYYNPGTVNEMCLLKGTRESAVSIRIPQWEPARA